MNNLSKLEEFKRWVKIWLRKWETPEKFIKKIGDPQSRYQILPEGPNEVRVEYPTPLPNIGSGDETFSLRSNIEIESKKAASLIVQKAKQNKHIWFQLSLYLFV